MSGNPYIGLVQDAFKDWLHPEQTLADLTRVFTKLPADLQIEFMAALVMVTTAEVQSCRQLVFQIMRDFALDAMPAAQPSAKTEGPAHRVAAVAPHGQVA